LAARAVLSADAGLLVSVLDARYEVTHFWLFVEFLVLKWSHEQSNKKITELKST